MQQKIPFIDFFFIKDAIFTEQFTEQFPRAEKTHQSNFTANKRPAIEKQFFIYQSTLSTSGTINEPLSYS
jgi:hypothetical protein